MIRAAFSFVLTLGALAVAALWLIDRLDTAQVVGKSPPVSRTVELVAEELRNSLPELPALAETKTPEPAAPERDRVETPADNASEKRVEEELTEPEALPRLWSHDETHAISAAEELPADRRPTRSAEPPWGGDSSEETPPQQVAEAEDGTETPVVAREDTLQESALLVRRMLGLYEQTVKAR